MATQRYISTSFWDDEWIQTLDPSEKLLYLYLLTNPLTNIAGVYKITVRRICFDTGFNADTVGHILAKFEKAGKAYLHKGYIILPTWPKHQKIHERQKLKIGLIAILQELPEDIIQFMYEIGYAFDLDSISSTVVGYKNREGISGAKKKRLIESAGNRCQICGSQGRLLIHHKKPIADGGDNTDSNLQVICETCHSKIHHSPDTISGRPDTLSGVPNYSDSDSDSDLDKDKDSDKDCPPAIKTTAELNKPKNNQKFIKPTLEEVSAYCQERSNGIDPQAFIDFYEAKGWRIGKEPMRDWQAAIRTWERRQMSEGRPSLRIFSQTASLDLPEA